MKFSEEKLFAADRRQPCRHSRRAPDDLGELESAGGRPTSSETPFEGTNPTEPTHWLAEPDTTTNGAAAIAIQ
jgi:hypothetical protein